MSITAERLDIEAVGSRRVVYRLSEPTSTQEHPEPFEHVVLSRGRLGDTCVFPSTSDGRILDLVGFGYGMGPSRWLADDEFDGYVADCIAQHEKDSGAGLVGYTEVDQ